MKKLMIFMLALCLITQPLFAGATPYSNAIKSKPNADWFSGASAKDVGWLWMKSADGLIGAGLGLGTGNIFYVDSNVTTEGDGQSWESAKDTIDEAIGLCTADRGDVILVAQGHQEVEATAVTSLFTLDVAGVSIIGMGNGGYEATVATGVITLNQRPTFVIDAADATITISAKHCRVSGLLIVSDIDNVAVGVTVAATADGLVFDNCVLRDNAANLDMLVMLSVAAGADNVQLVGNRFIANVAAGGNNAILLAGANANIEIRDNIAFGKYATGNLLGSAAAQVNATIDGNTFANSDGDAALTLHTSSTGMLTNNLLGGSTTIASTLVGDDAMWCFQNFVSGNVAGSGFLDPGVDGD